MKFLKKVVWVLILGIVSGNTMAEISVPFEMINGLIVVKAELNGIPGNYIIDSGSNGILLNNPSDKSDVSYQTLDASIEGSESSKNTLRIGNFESEELSAFSTDLSNVESYISKELAGIVGCSIFSPHSLAFDFKNEELIISNEPIEPSSLEGYSKLFFYSYEDLALAEIEIGGNLHTFVLDSGASSHFVDIKAIKTKGVSFQTTGISKRIVTAAGHNEPSLEYALGACKIGSRSDQLTAFDKDFSQVSELLNKKIAGLLSLSKLSEDLAYFDLQSKTLYYR